MPLTSAGRATVAAISLPIEKLHHPNRVRPDQEACRLITSH